MVFEAESDKIPFFKQYFSVIILAANIIVFIWQLSDPTGNMHIEAAFVPSDFFQGTNLWTLVTSMFMHGDIVHIVMNMWFFIIVTDNCEHAFGHILYLVAYFICGFAGSILHALSTLIIPVWGPILANIPSLGASGAIFGLMGIYVLIYSENKFYLPSSTGTSMRKVSAGYFILTYFIAELTYAIVSLTDPFALGQTAHFAHVGGFIAGAIIAVIFKGVKGTSYKKKKS
ncbi:MAG: rhomboid family intramembrane serine protease [Promethearchaeota archaeon]|nr:MAG: rhomboid family intramembrane serine protease [Candidatus Lokiarchaeota archaeon]